MVSDGNAPDPHGSATNRASGRPAWPLPAQRDLQAPSAQRAAENVSLECMSQSLRVAPRPRARQATHSATHPPLHQRRSYLECNCPQSRRVQDAQPGWYGPGQLWFHGHDCPVGCAEANHRRHKEYSIAVADTCREFRSVLYGISEAQELAHPLHGSPSHRDVAFQRVIERQLPTSPRQSWSRVSIARLSGEDRVARSSERSGPIGCLTVPATKQPCPAMAACESPIALTSGTLRSSSRPEHSPNRLLDALTAGNAREVSQTAQAVGHPTQQFLD